MIMARATASAEGKVAVMEREESMGSATVEAAAAAPAPAVVMRWGENTEEGSVVEEGVERVAGTEVLAAMAAAVERAEEAATALV